MVALTIDGIQTAVKSGTMILEAARRIGIRIPTLCYDKRLAPYGACGLCLVEAMIGGSRLTVPSCVTAADEGMEVATHTPSLVESRRMQLMLLLRTHPLQCPTCDAAGDCRLQKLVYEHEIPELPFARETRHFHIDNDSPFIRLNMDVCVKCGLCVRICDEVQGQNELGFTQRGIGFDVSTDFGAPLDCEFCGQCAQICPVGAISSKWLIGTGRQFELEKTNTVCSFCGMGCTLTLGVKDNKVVYVTSPDDSPNRGTLCAKGRYGWPYIYSEQRLSGPLIRKQGALEPVEWNEALSFVADGFLDIKRTSGPLSLAGLGSARLTNEEAYVFNRFVRTVMETPHLDHAGGYAYSALVDGLAPMLGYPASTNSIREIGNADVIVLLGADLAESHPVAKNEVIMATGPERQGKVIVLDSVRTSLCNRPGIQMLSPPGTEHLLAYAMLREIIDKGLYDRKALELTAEGFEDLVVSLEEYSPKKVGKLTGVNPDAIRLAAGTYAEAARATIILTTGVNRMRNCAVLAQAAANLAAVTGRLGRESCGVFVLGEKANSQGAIDMGLAPNALPGFHNIFDKNHRERFEAAWHFPLPRARGLDAHGILMNAELNRIRGLYVVGENPVETYPGRLQVERALSRLEFLVAQDMFLTSTAKMAHAVLPVACFAEKSGTYTSAERRVQLLRPILDRPESKSDLEIFHALARLMERPMAYEGPEQVMKEIAEQVDVYKGVSYERLTGHGVQWPFTDVERLGTAYLYEEGFRSGKARLMPAPPIEELLSYGIGLYLIPGAFKFHSGSFSQWSAPLMEVKPEAWVEMNPRDLKILGLRDGDLVRITSATGACLKAKVKWSARAVEGSVVAPQNPHSLELNSLIGWELPRVRVQVEKEPIHIKRPIILGHPAQKA